MSLDRAGDDVKTAAEGLGAAEIVEEAERVEDVYSADLLTARIGVHEEATWMLNAMLVEDARGSLATD